nr:Filament and Intermediate filament domain containing protein [Haemonchus contortus]
MDQIRITGKAESLETQGLNRVAFVDRIINEIYESKEQKEITTAHVFHTKQQRQYPQTRRVVYTPTRGSQSQYSMSSSPAYIDESDDDEMYRRRIYSTGNGKYNTAKQGPRPPRYHSSQIIQEVAISYSAPITISAPSSPLSRPLASSERANVIDEYSSVHDFITSQRHRQKSISSPESVERINARGRQETEFPVRIAYIGGESVHSVPITPVSSSTTYRGPAVDSRASTRLAESVVSETTTVQEMTTITTTSHGRSVSSSEMPGVTELTQRFERGSRSDSTDTVRATGQRPSQRVVVVSKPGPEFVYSSSDDSRVHRVDRPTYSPSDQKSVLSTTVVDIEPPTYRTVTPHYVEERYQLEEQFRSVKSYTSPTKKEPPYKPREVIIPTDKKTSKETFTGHTVFSSREQQREQEVDETRGSTPVRSVVEQFESKIEEGRSTPDRRPYQYKEKFEEMSVHEQHRGTQPDQREREVYIPRSDLLPSRKTYTESITSRKTIGPEKDQQPYKERREITREEVQRTPSFGGQRETRERVEQERIAPYREMREVRLEEVERTTQSRTEDRDMKREQTPVSPPPSKDYGETRRREDTSRSETVTTEIVRNFPRVAIPKGRSPTPPRVEKSTLEIAREELLEEKRRREVRRKEREEQEKKDQERREQERREQERREQERRDQERREQERRDQERREQERRDQERREQERRDQERREQERREQERREQERREQERREQEKREQERRERERREREESSREYRETRRSELYDYERKKETEETTTTTTKPAERTEMPSIYQEEHQHYSRRSGGIGARTQPLGGMAHTGATEFMSGSSVTAGEIRDIREREKREMRGLNDRLAAYIEQVRFLEAQNRKLSHDLERLTKGKHAPGIRQMYEKEISQSQTIIAEAKKDYGNLEKEVRGLTADLTDVRSRFDAAVKARNLGEEDDLIVKLCDLQAQICMTKRRNAVIEEECKRIRNENLKLNSDLASQRQLLEKESLQRMNYEHQAQALIEECKMIASSNNVKLDKYKYQDTTEENRAIFRQGLLEAIAEIRKLYDEATSKFRSEMESWYSKQVIEIRTGSRHAADAASIKEKVKTLRAELTEMRSKLANLEGRNHILEKLIQDLTYQIEDENRVSMAHLSEKDDEIRAVRAQCQAITVELEKLIVEKVNLDAEISKYRQLLEGEENRTHGRIISSASHSFEPTTQTTLSDVHVRSSAMRRVTGTNRSDTQRSAQGNVSILEVASDGSFVTIENTSVSHDEVIGDWKLRSSGSGRDITFTFPKDFRLTPKSKVTVYARGRGIHAPPHSLVFEAEDAFATGGDVRTYLYNEENQERASLIQRSAAY